MGSSPLVAVAVAAVLILLAGVLATVEVAITRASSARTEELARRGIRGANSLGHILEDRVRYANLVLLLRKVAEVTATVIVTVAVRDHWSLAWPAMLVVIVVMVLASYVIVGVGARTLGLQHPYRYGIASAWLVRLLGRVFGPLPSLLILLGNAITPGKGYRQGPFSNEIELREMVDLAEKGGLVESDEHRMIQSVFELGDTIAREVMVPRTEIVWIEAFKRVSQAQALALRSGFSRLPVVDESIDDVVGVVYLKDLIRRTQGNDRGATLTVSEVMRPPLFVPESKRVDDLLREMQALRTHIAVVIDEYGGTAGLITIEDILEEIVGEITDEYDRERAPVERIDADTARVSSRLSLEDLEREFDVEVPDSDDVETVAGLLAQALGKVPIPGAEVRVNGLELVAESAGGRRNRIDTVLVRRVHRAGESVEDDEHERVASGRREREAQ